MSEYYATINWQHTNGEDFIDNQYSRGHLWMFDGGLTVPASSSPHIVPLPFSIAANIDPEEAFVASIASCHMLFFLSIAAKKKFSIEQYTDEAIGVMETLNGKTAMTKVMLKPKIKFFGDQQPNTNQIKKMHDQSHEQCFIANSIKTKIIIQEPT